LAIPKTNQKLDKMKKIKLAIVEDHELYSVALNAVAEENPQLKVCGIFSTSQQFLNHVDKTLPEIVLINIKMPDVSGIDVTKTVLSQFPQIKMVGISMNPNEDDMQKMFSSGGVGYITKDASKKEFSDLFTVILRGDRFVGAAAAMTYTLSANKVKNGDVTTQIDNKQATLHYKITKREIEIVEHVAKGLADKEIAECLNLSCRTIHAHKQKIMAKLGTRKATEIVALCYKLKLIF
jgi:DNA-binding NarL/FixJ family response regulator